MIRLTKIFHFEMAHVIDGYPGACKDIHGHSYELHISVSSFHDDDGFIPAPGFVTDFKEIKKLVKSTIVDYFDHKLILSDRFLAKNPSFSTQENLVTWNMEPTAENILVYIKKLLHEKFPAEFKLDRIKLFETKDSYAEWIK
jgi:6-pyruvoyltetrahydropterin/6-carboxytetrahydropterin synthase